MCALSLVAAVALGGIAWVVIAVLSGALAALGIHDVLQRRHSILRNYPIVGHMRYILESIRPELQQYFIERNYDRRPYDRDTRTAIYERAKGVKDEQAYGTERDVAQPGYECLHSPAEVTPHHLVRRVDHVRAESYAELHEWLAPEQLLEDPPDTWIADWERADPDSFAPRVTAVRG